MPTPTSHEIRELVLRPTPSRTSVTTADLVAAMLDTDMRPGTIGAICCVPAAVQMPQLGTSLRVAMGGKPGHSLSERFWRTATTSLERRVATMGRVATDVGPETAMIENDPRAMLRAIADATGRWTTCPRGSGAIVDQATSYGKVEEWLIDWLASQEHFRSRGYRMHPTAFRSRMMDSRDPAILDLGLAVGLDAAPWRAIRQAARDAPNAARRADIEKTLDRVDAQTAFTIGAIQSGPEDAVTAARLFGVQSVASARSTALAMHRSPNVPKHLGQELLDSLRDWYRDGLGGYEEALRAPASTPMRFMLPTMPASFAPILAERPDATLSDLDPNEVRATGVAVGEAGDMLEDLQALAPMSLGLHVAQVVRVLRRHGPDPARMPGGVISDVIQTESRKGAMDMSPRRPSPPPVREATVKQANATTERLLPG